jgi:hypothetical protein
MQWANPLMIYLDRALPADDHSDHPTLMGYLACLEADDGVDWLALVLAGSGALAAALGYSNFATMLLVGAGYPTGRLALRQLADTPRSEKEHPAPRAAPVLDRDSAAWAGMCCVGASGSLLAGSVSWAALLVVLGSFSAPGSVVPVSIPRIFPFVF